MREASRLQRTGDSKHSTLKRSIAMSEPILFSPIPNRKNFTNLTNHEPFDRLSILGYAGLRPAYSNGPNAASWYCQCSCDLKTILILPVTGLLSGNTRSCGCLQKEAAARTSTTHGQSQTRLYCIWDNMKSRCYNENNTAYSYYGERGIRIEDVWHTFEPFMEWSLEHGYDDSLEIDRKDTNGNYGPGNCRWVTKVINQRNKGKAKGKSSQFLGVYYDKVNSKWRAEAKIGSKRHRIGRFSLEEEAARARDALMDLHCPDTFQRNFPMTTPPADQTPEVPPALS